MALSRKASLQDRSRYTFPALHTCAQEKDTEVVDAGGLLNRERCVRFINLLQVGLPVIAIMS
jgi:hypothetical protein